MIEQQIRPWNRISDPILALLADIDRADYVPESYQNLAYADFEIPLSDQQNMLTPKMEARMLDLLAITQIQKILEIGTGSGYFTTCLAKMGLWVDSWEISPTLFDLVEHKIAQQKIHNIQLYQGDGLIQTNTNQYDIIVLTGSICKLHANLEEKLTIGGKLLAVVGEAPIMETMLITRTGANAYTRQVIFETYITPLQEETHPTFQF